MAHDPNELYARAQKPERAGLPAALDLGQFLKVTGREKPLPADDEATRNLRSEERNHWALAARSYWRDAKNPLRNPVVQRADITSVEQCFAALGLNTGDALHCNAVLETSPARFKMVKEFLEEAARQYVRDFTPQKGLARLRAMNELTAGLYRRGLKFE